MPALWTSEGIGARAARLALLPAAALFRAVSGVRNAMYDAGILRAVSLGAPTVSIGNLTVGGTGKTPVAAWFADVLARRARPAILLRGYGEDESSVHQILTPSAIVVPNADRVAGAREAIARGADVLILDDGFQHRRAARDADVVLISADAAGASWSLPAGPYREPMSALRRASMVVVTRKAATDAAVDAIVAKVTNLRTGAPVCVFSLAANELVSVDGNARRTLDDVANASVLAMSAIGNPEAFEAQLAARGARVTAARFTDHHAYSPGDVEALVARASSSVFAVCTLKDAVKLRPLWPHTATPLWYVSQRITIERGADAVAELVAKLVAARGANPLETHQSTQ